MAQTVIDGLRDVQTAQANIIPPQVLQNQIDLLTMNDAPFTALTRAASKKKAVGDNTFFIYQDLLLKKHTTLASAAAVAATSWVLTNADAVNNWDILWNRTRNVFVHVKSISSATCTVLANADSGTDTAGQVGDEIIVIGSAHQESNGPGVMLSTQETKRTNYIVDVRTYMEFSSLAEFSDSYFQKKDVDYQRMKLAIEHQRSLERHLKLGPAPALITPAATYANPVQLSSYRAGLTQSFRAFMNAYADADHIKTETDLTEFEFIDLIQHVFFAEHEGNNKGNKKVVCFAAPELASGMTRWFIGDGRFQMEKMSSTKPKTLGLNFNRWTSPFGTIDFIWDHELSSTISGGTHYAFFCDVSRIGYTPYRGHDTNYKENIVMDGRERTVSRLRTVLGSHFTQENAHLWLKWKTIS